MNTKCNNSNREIVKSNNGRKKSSKAKKLRERRKIEEAFAAEILSKALRMAVPKPVSRDSVRVVKKDGTVIEYKKV